MCKDLVAPWRRIRFSVDITMRVPLVPRSTRERDALAIAQAAAAEDDCKAQQRQRAAAQRHRRPRAAAVPWHVTEQRPLRVEQSSCSPVTGRDAQEHSGRHSVMARLRYLFGVPQMPSTALSNRTIDPLSVQRRVPRGQGRSPASFFQVCIFFGDKLLRGNRACKLSNVDVDAFDSPNFPPLGKLTTANLSKQIKLNWQLLRQPPRGRLSVHRNVRSNILVTRLVPGFSDEVWT